MYVTETNEEYLLTPAQREIWYDQLLHGGTSRYNVGACVEIDGPLDVELLERALGMLVAGSDVLRAVFDGGADGTVPRQRFVDEVVWSLERHDFSGEVDAAGACRGWIDIRCGMGFEVEGKGPLFRFALLKEAEGRWHWVTQLHHLICDGWSASLIYRRVAELYTGLLKGEVMDVAWPQFRDEIEGALEYMGSAAYGADEAYWAGKFGEVPDALYGGRGGVAGDGRASRRHTWVIPRSDYVRLKEMAAGRGCSVFHVMVGLLQVWYSRSQRLEGVAIGLPVLNRPDRRSKGVLGLFTGLVPLWMAVGQGRSFEDQMLAVRGEMRSVLRHQRLPISRINRLAGLDPSGRGQLFDVVVSYERHDYSEGLGDCKTRVYTLGNWHEAHALTVHIQEEGEGDDVRVDFDYRVDAFGEGEVELLVERLGMMLGEVLGNPGVEVGKVGLVLDRERRLLAGYQGDGGRLTENRLRFDELFRECVEAAPGAEMLVCGERSWTAREVLGEAEKVARALALQLGVEAGQAVALLLPRRAEMVFAIWGVILAGGAYVPIDPSFPPSRIAWMLEDSGAQCLVCVGEGRSYAEAAGLAWLDLDVAMGMEAGTFQLEGRPLEPEDYLYTMYTSGSTGQPKGVRVRHVNLVEQWKNMLHPEGFNLRQGDRFLALTIYTFDPSLLELVLAPLSGMTVVFVDEEVGGSPEGIVEVIVDAGVDVLQMTPTRLRMLVEAKGTGFLEGVKTLLVGGEPFPPEMLVALDHLKGLEIRNIYGPTETTVWSTAQVIRYGRAITVGRPMPQTEVLILDQGLELVPPGVTGEICITGVGLTDGYLNRPEMDAVHFVGHPFREGEGLYRTGDLGAWVLDGEIDYRGRKDDQIKIRGRRIEPGEIRAVLMGVTGAQQAVVMAVAREDGEKVLMAWYQADQEWDAGELREALGRELPAYMVPVCVWVGVMPLLPNGKINKKALPVPELGMGGVDEVPEGEQEGVLAEVWESVLGIKGVGRNTHYFQVGGDSITATRIISGLRGRGWALSLKELFAWPVLKEQAGRMRRLAIAGDAVVRPLVSEAEWKRVNGMLRGRVIEDAYPLTPMQEGMLFHALRAEGGGTYVEQSVLDIVGGLDRGVFERAFADLCARHGALRTVCLWDGLDRPLLVVLWVV